jgi:NAD(P)-dependent dehydrogenase (short-subunit alcohol dehydrogenase family)
MKDFKDAVVAVTGAGSGIGRAIGLRFAGLGAKVALSDVSAERVNAVKAEIESRGGSASARAVDVADRAAMREYAAACRADYGRVDVLVNNAGVGYGGELKDMGLEDWDWIMGINFMGMVTGVHVFVPDMVGRGQGHIVNICSVNGLVATPMNGAYCAAKHAAVGFTTALRYELARHHVGVTAICPGFINTNIVRDSRLKPNSAEQSSLIDRTRQFFIDHGLAPEDLAKIIPPAVLKNKAMVVHPFHAKLLSFSQRHTPNLHRFVTSQIVKHTQGLGKD